MSDFRTPFNENDKQWTKNRTSQMPQKCHPNHTLNVQRYPNVRPSQYLSPKPNKFAQNSNLEHLKHGLPTLQNVCAANPFESFGDANTRISNASRLSQPYLPPVTQMNNSHRNNLPFSSTNEKPNFLRPSETAVMTDADNSIQQMSCPASSILNINNYPSNHVRPPLSFQNSVSNQLVHMTSCNSELMQNTNNWQHHYPSMPPLGIVPITNEQQNQNSFRPPLPVRFPMIDSVHSSSNAINNFNSNSAQNPFNVSRVLPPTSSSFGGQNQTVADSSNSFQSHDSILTLPPPLHPNMYSFPPPFMPPVTPNSNFTSTSHQSGLPTSSVMISEKEKLLSQFLRKFHPKDKVPKKKTLSVVEFRSAVKIGLSLIKLLSDSKSNLKRLLDCDENNWNSQIKMILQMQNQLVKVCDMLNNPSNITCIQRKLEIIRKKRNFKKRQKLRITESKIKAEEYRKELNQEIDKWLDNIKEKNLNEKRKQEMKTEADKILSEVRRKIHEAKRTIEKIKVFEKLRNARSTNAMQKSLIIQPEHTEKFEKKVSFLKETMLKQLSDYEAEEKALKVILETEQEGQLEEEAMWRIKKRKVIQQKKQKNIVECLFGDADEPGPSDPLYLFYSHQNAANYSIESLVQIRHHWDLYLSDDGEPIPQQWVTPVPPRNNSWDPYCNS